MISTKQIRFLLKGAKKLNAGIASIKRFGRPAEEIGMTFAEGARLQKVRAGLASTLHSGIVREANIGARMSAIGAAEKARKAARNASLGASMGAMGRFQSLRPLSRMPAAQGASLLRKAKVGGMQLMRTARKKGYTTSAASQRIGQMASSLRSRLPAGYGR